VGTHKQERAESTTHPDGSPRRWPDGSPRSWGNGFTHGIGAEPHGYKRGSAIAATPERRKRGPRSQMAFGTPEGSIAGMGAEHAYNKPMHLLRKVA
jgi:hypothetical protein